MNRLTRHDLGGNRLVKCRGSWIIRFDHIHECLADRPGVAPGAKLYALRVFDCQVNSALFVQAVNWAAGPNGDGDFSDRLDVLDMSIGSSFGLLDGSCFRGSQ